MTTTNKFLHHLDLREVGRVAKAIWQELFSKFRLVPVPIIEYALVQVYMNVAQGVRSYEPATRDRRYAIACTHAQDTLTEIILSVGRMTEADLVKAEQEHADRNVHDSR